MGGIHQLQWIVTYFSKLIETEEVYFALLNVHLEVLHLPKRTAYFLQKHYNTNDIGGIPEDLLKTIQRERHVPEDSASPMPTFSFKQYPPGGHFLCRGFPITLNGGKNAILLKLIPYGPTEDFSHLTGIGLTPREVELLSFLPLGYPNSAIAMAMDISDNGVKKHLNSIAAKLNAKGRTEILYKAMLKKREIFALA
ncbi:helix-turn-helix transcriptional regulator [Desulfatitalea alkaliphila]|uniref:Helix-turn-helix transcriptional regulator n=1 Tax=Desulfatitalea alkaliphila TaxID=2929485 RepID=A0AA41UI04_9BACT|nr:helix-turn-helix transcriptional regulator [Desulfatitalea alkaliphila]MCJ8500220.1 helix-turn-helix transcriptional regulator [Desulfatitalea alkaliphila]